MSSRGLRLERSENVLYAVLPIAAVHLDNPPSGQVTIAKDFGENDGDFIRLLMGGTAPTDIEMRRQVGLSEFQNWNRYVAYVKNEPAALAARWHKNKNAFLASAWTKPELRGLGCQTELLKRRIADAARLGCSMVISQAVPGSQSQRNLERLGMRVAYTRSIWIYEQ